MPKYQFRIGQTEDGKPVKLDLETFIETRAAFIANSGGGKSHALRTIIEQSGERVQWIIVDPEGEYSSLREMFPNMLLIGKEGELPVDLKSAKLLARKVMETRVSTIVDLYGMMELRAPWVAVFVTALINLPRDLWSPVIVAVDEAHRLAPETPSGNKVERANLYESRKAIITLADSGRKQSRGAVIASQRVSKMASDARAELRNRFVGLTVQDLDRDRAADDLGFSKAQARELRDLKAGQFYAYGPALVGVQGIVKVQFDLPKTKHPRPGTKQMLEIPPASDALRSLVAQMGDLPKQATEEADTIAAAQRRIAELERQVRERPVVQAQPRVEQVVKTVEVPVLKPEELARLETAISKFSEASAQMANAGNGLIAASADAVGAAKTIGQALSAASRAPRPAPSFAPRPSAPSAPASIQRRTAAAPENGELRGGERLILIASAQYPDGVTREQLTILSGYKRSSRDTYIQRLAARGYIEVARDRIFATPEGVAALGNDYQPLPTGQALIEYWLARLTGGEQVVFEAVIREYPNEVRRDDLDERIGYKRSSRDTYIQRLQARELVVTTGRAAIKANPNLFR
jgi:hypothetical protein